MKKRWKLLLILLAIGSGAYLYLNIRKTKDFEPQIKDKLARLVKDASNGLYKLDVEQIEIDITAGAVVAKNVLLSLDSSRMLELEKINAVGNDTYEIALKEINLEGLSALELLNAKNIDLDKLVLDSPDIRITHKVRKETVKDTGNLYERLASHDQSYSIRNLLLNNIRFTFTNLDKNRSVSSLKNLSAFFTGIKIDSSTKNDTTRFLFAEEALITVKGFSQVTEKKRYHFNIDSIALRPQNGSLEFYALSLKPEGTKQDFNKLISFQQDRYDIQVKKGSVTNIQWFDLLAGEGLFGDEVKAEGGTINIYHDRSLPSGPPKANNFPHQMLMKTALPVSLKKILLQDFAVSYEELNPKSMHTGTVSFYNVNGEIANVTNVDTDIKNAPLTTITASADFMNEGKLDAVFRFDLANVNTGKFSVDATLGPMNGVSLNKITEGLALVKIKSAGVDKLRLNLTGTGKSARANVLFAYHDLSFDVLKNDEGELKKRGLFSFIANAVMINKSNPKKKDGEAKAFVVMQQHDPSRSFFNLIWRTLLQGILKTVK